MDAYWSKYKVKILNTGELYTLSEGGADSFYYNIMKLDNGGLKTVKSLSLTKVEKIGKIGDNGYPGVKYSYNKGQGRAVRSIELHSRHNGHGIHLQGNKRNPRTGARAGVFFRKTIWR